MTWLFFSAAFALAWCIYRLAVLLQRPLHPYEPVRHQVREAMAKILAQEPHREPIHTYDGDQRHRQQYRVVQMGPRKVSGL